MYLCMSFPSPPHCTLTTPTATLVTIPPPLSPRLASSPSSRLEAHHLNERLSEAPGPKPREALVGCFGPPPSGPHATSWPLALFRAQLMGRKLWLPGFLAPAAGSPACYTLRSSTALWGGCAGGGGTCLCPPDRGAGQRICPSSRGCDWPGGALTGQRSPRPTRTRPGPVESQHRA